MQVDWAEVRGEFPVLENWVHLNTATFGPIPRCAVRAAAAHFANRDQNGCLDFLDWYSRADEVRAKAGRLIGASADDIAFIPNAGTALSWVLNGIDWKPGDRIVSLSEEFPNNLYAPIMQRRRGIEFVEARGGEEFSPEDLLSRIDEHTRVVLVSALNYASGLQPPLERIGAALHDHPALFVIDGTQGVGAIEFDVDRVGADAVIVHAYKWMLSPAGIGFLYVRPEARRRIEPTVFSWRSHRGWREVDHLHHGAPEVPEEAMRYEGGVLNFSGLFAMEAVLDLYEAIGREEILGRVREMTVQTRDALRSVGGDLSCDRSEWFDSPIVTARFSGGDVSETAAELRRRKVLVAARKGNLRVSPHFFNNQDDLDRLAAELRSILAGRVQIAVADPPAEER